MGRNLTNLPISASFQYLAQVSGSENDVTDGLGVDIDSLNVDITGTATTASYVAGANVDGTVANATSASFATTASFALNAETVDTGSLMETGSVALNVLTFTKGDGSTFDLTVDTGSAVTTPTGSLLTTASAADATITFTKGDSSTFDVTVDNVTTANTASYVAGANVDGTVATATSASYAQTASLALDLPSDATININTITASFASFTSASIGYLQTITGSAKIIGDAFIILNNDTPTERYAGILVQDSGSSQATASFQFDGETNDWFYTYSSSDDTDLAVAMFGPEYSTKGSPTYLTNNTIPKGDGGHHLNDSSISDDGTDVTVNANISASGYISGSEFIGDGSKLTGISTDPFPYTGDAEITGSLTVVDGNIVNGTGISDASINIEAIGGANTISTDGANAAGSVTIGQNNTSGKRDVVIGIDNSSPEAGEGSIQVVVGHSNTVSSPDFTDNNTIVGVSNTINGNGDGRVVLGYNNTVNASSHSGVIGGTANTSGHNNSVVVGGTGLSTSKTDEVVVDNLSVYGETFISSSTLGTGSFIDNLGQQDIPAASGSQVQHIVNLSQTEYDALTPDANTLYVIDGSEVLGDTVVSGSLIGEVSTLSIASNTASMDCSAGNMFTLEINQQTDVHLDVSNIQTGQVINLEVTHDATNSGSLSFATEFKFPGGTAPTITEAASSIDVLSFTSFDGTNLLGTSLLNFS